MPKKTPGRKRAKPRAARNPERPAAADADEFSLEAPTPARSNAPAAGRARSPAARGGQAAAASEILSYRHADKRKNNPEVGMVKPENDPDDHEERWCYDPHIDPALQFDFGRAQVEKLIDDALASGDQDAMRAALLELKRYSAPYLNWTGKAERTAFEVETVSLHVHERIDPASILSAVRKNMKNPSPRGRGEGVRAGGNDAYMHQPDLFAAPFENLPLRDAIDFYKHERGWANRLIAGDSLLVMNSLLQKESLAGQVQMIYIDPPYGIKYGSNFQPFVNKRDVKDRKDEDLTQEPEMIKAFRDTWELGIHSYLTYLRDRLLLAKELLHESGSVFVQISDENVHHLRELLDELFGDENFCAQINYRSMSPLGQKGLASVYDYVIWYSKDKAKMKFRPIYKSREIEDEPEFCFLDNGGGTFKKFSTKDISSLSSEDRKSVFKRSVLTSSGYTPSCTYDFEAFNKKHSPLSGKSWRTHSTGMERLIKANRLVILGSNPYFRQFHSDFNLIQLENSWSDTAAGYSEQKVYVVQTSDRVIERCLLMATDPGDLVLDPTCGSGTTAFISEKWGRRWITCDSSRVSVTLAKQRLMTASYDYFELKYPHEGLKSGFIYSSVPHVTLGAIANAPEIDEIYARMHPAVEEGLAELNKAAKQKLKEWEVPFDFPADWPEAAGKAFDTFHTAR